MVNALVLASINKSCVAQSFKASVATYEDNAIVQKQVCENLAGLVADHGGESFGATLEIGVGTGYLSRLLASRFTLDHFYVNDLVAECCELTKLRVGQGCARVISCPGDIEEIQLPEKIDLIVSASTLQWMVNLPDLLRRLHQSLAQSGLLAFSLFGSGTMAEIQELTGRSLLYYNMSQLIEIIEENFTLLVMRHDPHRIFFPSARAVLRHIKATGVGGLGGQKGWTASRLKEFEGQYRKKFATGQGLPVSYSAITVIARKKR